MSGIPPLKISTTDGSFAQIPVFELELSGGTLQKLSPSKVRLLIGGAQGPSGPPGASVVYAPTGGPYVTFATDAGLSNEHVLTASDNITITTSATAVLISATTSNISGKQDSITFPLSIGSGGTGRSTTGNYATILGNSAGFQFFAIQASDNITITNAGTSILISATTNAGGGSGASTAGNYVVFSSDTGLSNEKVLTAGSSVNITTDATAIYINALTNAAGGVVYAPTGGFYITYTADTLLASEKVLAAGSSVTITTDSTSIFINALTNAAGGVVYAPTGGNYIAFAADSNLSNEKVLQASNATISIVTDSTGFYISANTGAGSGSGTVNTGSATYLAYYPASGTTVDDTTISVSTGSGIAPFNVSILTSGIASPSSGDFWTQSSSNQILIGVRSNNSNYFTMAMTGWYLPLVSTSGYITTAQTTTDTNLVNITNMRFPIGANEIWSAEFYASTGESGAAGGRFGVNVPVGATLGGSGRGTVASGEIIVNTASTVAVTVASASVVLQVLIQNSSNAGDVQMRFASANTTITTTVNGNGTYFFARRIL